MGPRVRTELLRTQGLRPVEGPQQTPPHHATQAAAATTPPDGHHRHQNTVGPAQAEQQTDRHDQRRPCPRDGPHRPPWATRPLVGAFQEGVQVPPRHAGLSHTATVRPRQGRGQTELSSPTLLPLTQLPTQVGPRRPPPPPTQRPGRPPRAGPLLLTGHCLPSTVAHVAEWGKNVKTCR